MKYLLLVVIAACQSPRPSQSPTVNTSAIGDRINGMGGRVSTIGGKTVVIAKQVQVTRTLADRIDYKARILEEDK